MRIKLEVGIFLLILTLFFQGCATLKGAASGAAEGFKQDMESAQKIDAWMQEHMW